jgi:hypothetical protein
MIRPAYWTDADLHTRLTAEQREFYIGLWMLADDAGYVAWDLNRVGAELYPFRSLAWRSKRLPEWVALLAPHVKTLDCGRHLLVPKLDQYQKPPRPSFQERTAHERCVRQMAADGTTWGQVVPAQEVEGVEGKGKGLERARTRENDKPRADEETPFSRRLPRSVALGRRAS